MGVLKARVGGQWVSLFASAPQMPTRIGYAVSPGRDQTQGIGVWCQVNFTLPSQRLVKIECAGRYSYVSTAMNVSCYLNLGWDLNRLMQTGLSYSIAVGQTVNFDCACWAVLAAGAHTAEMHTVNNMTTGAMRFAASASDSWLSVTDWGPA